jgi:hypothetical protein
MTSLSYIACILGPLWAGWMIDRLRLFYGVLLGLFAFAMLVLIRFPPFF